jgi:hypothetical protein
MKDKCDLLLTMHARELRMLLTEACAGHRKKPERSIKSVFPAADISRGAVAHDPSPMMMQMLRSPASEASSTCPPLQSLAPRHAQTTRDVFVARGVSRRRLLRETLPRCKFLLLRSKALAALALTAPLGSLAQGFKAFRAQEILLCWREISQN